MHTTDQLRGRLSTDNNHQSLWQGSDGFYLLFSAEGDQKPQTMPVNPGISFNLISKRELWGGVHHLSAFSPTYQELVENYHAYHCVATNFCGFFLLAAYTSN